jgi:hypothetical protein
MRAVKEYGIAERERAGGLACSARRDDPARISDVAHASRPSCDFEPAAGPAGRHLHCIGHGMPAPPQPS